MVTDILDACPECKSHDVTCMNRMGRGYQKPRCYCYDCGIRFNNPKRYDKVTEEFV